ncbi:MAG: hypothetical protein ACRCZK_01810 [Oscillospiraceae bacterium]
MKTLDFNKDVTVTGVKGQEVINMINPEEVYSKTELVKLLFTNTKGNIDISNLDLSDFEGDLNQTFEYNLFQDNQDVKGNIYQDESEDK